ncbi:hypothetical protein EU971_07245, partial [Yersinia pseudotuberculosis]
PGADALLFCLSSPFKSESSGFVSSLTPGIHRIPGVFFISNDFLSPLPHFCWCHNLWQRHIPIFTR